MNNIKCTFCDADNSLGNIVCNICSGELIEDHISVIITGNKCDFVKKDESSRMLTDEWLCGPCQVRQSYQNTYCRMCGYDRNAVGHWSCDICYSLTEFSKDVCDICDAWNGRHLPAKFSQYCGNNLVSTNGQQCGDCIETNIVQCPFCDIPTTDDGCGVCYASREDMRRYIDGITEKQKLVEENENVHLQNSDNRPSFEEESNVECEDNYYKIDEDSTDNRGIEDQYFKKKVFDTGRTDVMVEDHLLTVKYQLDHRKWKCTLCGLYNEYLLKNCDACFTEYSHGRWFCGQCTMENSCAEEVCEACKIRNCNLIAVERKTNAKEKENEINYYLDKCNDNCPKNEVDDEKLTGGELRSLIEYSSEECRACSGLHKDCRWSCERCTMRNICSDNLCVACGESNSNVRINSNENAMAFETKQCDNQPWVCGACGLLNEYNFMNCSLCGTIYRDGRWICKECTLENNCSTDVCEVCGFRNINVRLMNDDDGNEEDTRDNNKGQITFDDLSRVEGLCPPKNVITNIPLKDKLEIISNGQVDNDIDKWECGECKCLNEYALVNCKKCAGLNKKGRWTCVDCHMENSCAKDLCNYCHKTNVHVKEGMTDLEPNELVSAKNDVKDEDPNNSLHVANWKCNNCEQMYSYKCTHCSACDIGRFKYGSWTCFNCTHINDCSTHSCRKCGARNENLVINYCKYCDTNRVSTIDEICHMCYKQWTCYNHIISAQNSATSDHCQICGLYRFYLYYDKDLWEQFLDNKIRKVWFCHKCKKSYELTERCPGYFCAQRNDGNADKDSTSIMNCHSLRFQRSFTLPH